MRIPVRFPAFLSAFLAAVLVLGLAPAALARDPEQAPGYGTPAGTSRDPLHVTPSCSLVAHDGVEEAEAKTAAGIVCHELVKRDPRRPYEVRFGTLNGRTLVLVSRRDGDTYDERRTFLGGLDEIDVAAPRLAEALVEDKPLAETVTVDSVLTAEARKGKRKQGSLGVEGGIFAATGVGGATSDAGGGLALGLFYRGEQYGVGLMGRAGGIGSGESTLSLLSLDFGGRYYLFPSDVSPYFGGGFAIGSIEVERVGRDLEGSGFGAYAQAGLEVLRTHNTGLGLALRVDLPFYDVEGGTEYVGEDPSGRAIHRENAAYVAPVSLIIGMTFQ